ncbi:MAG: outer membrane beta-barrel protein [Flammeovirgaceae bacterium]|nr:outer membrane beta-barrel protein [Flammeovirgaceae bacterium]
MIFQLRLFLSSVSILLCFISTPAISQLEQRSEFGFGIGTFNYTGDLVRTYNFGNSKPAATVFYRANISTVISFRTSVTAGKIGADDFKNPVDAFASARASSFNLFMMEASMVAEYHFLNWRDDKRRLRFTPYLFSGFALFGISGTGSKPESYSNVQPSIPIGGGFKYVINPRWYAALEVGIRKTFFDYLDNVSDGDQAFKDYQYGNKYDNDNYFFLGLTITRTLYNIPCATNPYR